MYSVIYINKNNPYRRIIRVNVEDQNIDLVPVVRNGGLVSLCVMKRGMYDGYNSGNDPEYSILERENREFPEDVNTDNEWEAELCNGHIFNKYTEIIIPSESVKPYLYVTTLGEYMEDVLELTEC